MPVLVNTQFEPLASDVRIKCLRIARAREVSTGPGLPKWQMPSLQPTLVQVRRMEAG